MILEAQQIYESLCDAAWDISVTHDDLKRPGKSASIRAVISSNAQSVESITILSSDETHKHWNQANGKQNGFPIFKLNAPVIGILENNEFELWKKEKSSAKKREISSIWLNEKLPETINVNIKDSFKERLTERHSQLTQLTNTPASRFLDLIQIFSKVTPETYSKWVYEIITHLRDKIASTTHDSTVAENLLIPLMFSKGENAKVTIIWDLKPSSLNGSSASSPSNFKHLNKALIDAQSTPRTSKPSGVCSITNSGALITSTFPEVSLPQIGPSILYSRFEPVKSFHRYNQHGAGAFPLSHNHAAKLAGALSALTSPEREGKTWAKVNASNSTKPDLLIAFQASLADQQFASALGSNQFQTGEAGFEELCKRLIERTKGKVTDQLRGKLFIAVLRAVDKANRKVILHKDLNIDSLEKSALLWQAGCKALPGLKLHIPTEKGKPALHMSPPVLNPGSLPSLTKTFHFLDGGSSDSPGGITFPDAMQLLLTMQSPDSKLVKRCLSITLRRLGPLLHRVASIKHRSTSNRIEFKSEKTQNEANVRWNILKAQSLFSVLITSSTRTSNTVMNSIAYQLGQLCSAFDLIHAGYCHQERGGDLPPKLLGNICFQSANRNPTAALSQLSQRAAPHLAWAKRPWKNDTPNDKLSKEEWAIIRGRSAARNINDHSEKIHEALISNQSPVDDLFRSELLLGYMAGFPKKNQTETTNQD